MTELVPSAKELGIKRVIIKMLQLSQVNLSFVPCPFKSVKQNIHSATMSGPQHKHSVCISSRLISHCVLSLGKTFYPLLSTGSIQEDRKFLTGT